MWGRSAAALVATTLLGASPSPDPFSVRRPGAAERTRQASSDLLRASCLTCHGPELIAQQRLAQDGWSRELDKMAGWGASIEAADRPALLEYLTSSFGLESPPGDAGADAGASLVRARCLVCHDLRLIEQQRLDLDGWRREVDKMIGWGARVRDQDRAGLLDYLFSSYGPRRR